jgi:hypothetical protein
LSTTVYITIGNSDDKLSQVEWYKFAADVDRAFNDAVKFEGARAHGRWYSLPNEPWQNACWCAEWDDGLDHIVRLFKHRLAGLARDYRQDSIAWAEATTEFIGPSGETE